MVRRKKKQRANSRNRIVILGGGFGGVRTARMLDRLLDASCEIIVIDKKGYHLPQWMLYEIATLHMPKEDAVDFHDVRIASGIPFSSIFKGTRVTFLQAEVRDVLISEKKVALTISQEDGSPHLGFLSFDYLVFALGGETNYFGISGMEEGALALKDLDDALNVRNAVEELCARKSREQNLQIVIGGGGFTGVELASELVGYLKKLTEKYALDPKRIRLSLVEANSALLPGSAKWVAHGALRRLHQLGVSVELLSQIERFSDGQIFLKGGKIMPADLLVWTAGIRANRLLEHVTGAELAKSCLEVNQFLQLSGHEKLFGVGDNVYCFNSVKNVQVPPTAQRALDQADSAAYNIVASIRGKQMKPFVPREPVFIVPLGGKHAVADFGFFGARGMLAWSLKMAAGLRYLVSILPLPYAFRFWWKSMTLFVRND